MAEETFTLMYLGSGSHMQWNIDWTVSDNWLLGKAPGNYNPPAVPSAYRNINIIIDLTNMGTNIAVNIIGNSAYGNYKSLTIKSPNVSVSSVNFTLTSVYFKYITISNDIILDYSGYVDADKQNECMLTVNNTARFTLNTTPEKYWYYYYYNLDPNAPITVKKLGTGRLLISSPAPTTRAVDYVVGQNITIDGVVTAQPGGALELLNNKVNGNITLISENDPDSTNYSTLNFRPSSSPLVYPADKTILSIGSANRILVTRGTNVVNSFEGQYKRIEITTSTLTLGNGIVEKSQLKANSLVLNGTLIFNYDGSAIYKPDDSYTMSLINGVMSGTGKLKLLSKSSLTINLNIDNPLILFSGTIEIEAGANLHATHGSITNVISSIVNGKLVYEYDSTYYDSNPEDGVEITPVDINQTISGAGQLVLGYTSYLKFIKDMSGFTGEIIVGPDATAHIGNGTVGQLINIGASSITVYGSLTYNLSGTAPTTVDGKLVYGMTPTLSTPFAGGGKLTLSGVSSYKLIVPVGDFYGTLTVDATAALQIGDNVPDVNMVISPWKLIVNGTVTFKLAGDMSELQTVLSGTGNLKVLSPTKLLFRDSSPDFTGALAVESGATAQIGNATAGKLVDIGATSMVVDGTLIYNVSGINSGITANITGSGTVRLSGASKYIYGSAMPPTGPVPTTVVTSGTRVSGSGNVGPLTLESGAIMAPGNSPGLLTVNGNFTLSAGTIYEWELGGYSDAIGDRGTIYDAVDVVGDVLIDANAELQIKLLGISISDPFWDQARTWDVIRTPGKSNFNQSFQIRRLYIGGVERTANGNLLASSFSDSPVTDHLALSWTPLVPGSVEVVFDKLMEGVNLTGNLDSNNNGIGTMITVDLEIAELTPESIDAMLTPIAMVTDRETQTTNTDLIQRLIYTANAPILLGSKSIIDADGLYQVTENSPGVYLTLLAANGVDNNMLACYYVPPGDSAPLIPEEIRQLYVLMPNTANSDQIVRGTRIRLPVGSPTTQPGTFTSDGSTIVYNYPNSTDPFTVALPNTVAGDAPETRGRYGFVLLNKGWQLLKSLGGSTSYNEQPAIDTRNLSWPQIRDICRFSQWRLNSYDGYSGPSSVTATDNTHYAAQHIANIVSNRALDVFMIEDLPLTPLEEANKTYHGIEFEKSDRDFNDVVFGLEQM
jgi:hypothetical protein